ncbi:MAG: diadenylate cyclase CdaA [Thermoflexales bacterium]|nr:diadenylate cyclase CdaA [Thermoflexales bacterium]MCS7325047.1 diadenylate cyclase CdaA [Thermoflexales bacterium]MDW8054168.1 diadenylate cyclase CdaA [Anaerolineae bacterium]MDW8292312.1 diadenylate cyclase CdaA [Anaerolineae bacterium]
MIELFWLLQRLTPLAVLDIALVALLFFGALLLVRATQAVSVLRGLVILGLISLALGSSAQLPAFNLVMRTVLPALLVAIPVIFQPELRRALERLGRFNEVLTAPRRSETEIVVRKVSEAAQRLANKHHGALIVLERETGLQHLIDSGVKLDAELSPELLLAIFDPHSPLHDGGVIIRHGRVAAAACVLPLTTSTPEDMRIGLRHRAGIGVTEGSDAVAVIVSEERGTISIAHSGRLIRRIDPAHLESALIALVQPVLPRATSLLGLFRQERAREQ